MFGYFRMGTAKGGYRLDPDDYICPDMESRYGSVV